MNSNNLLNDLLGQLAEPFTAEVLFDQVQDTVFFVKDGQGRYVCTNQTLVNRCGVKSKADILGRSPSELFGKELGKGYEDQDQEVISSGRTLLDKLELHSYRSSDVGWCLTSKIPLIGRSGHVIGLTGISRDLALPDSTDSEYKRISKALEFAESEFSTPLTVADMAKTASMTPYQLDRRMRRLFGLSTGQWLLKTRINYACQQLAETRDPITAIALDCGYTDHSAFTRQFRKTTGRTPRDFRNLIGSLRAKNTD